MTVFFHKLIKMRVSCLIVIAFLGSSSLAFGQCKTIEASATVTDTQGGAKNGKIVLEIKNLAQSQFQISLFEPQGKRRINLEQKEFDNLPKGKYLIVIVGKKEEDNYCPKSIDVTIN